MSISEYESQLMFEARDLQMEIEQIETCNELTPEQYNFKRQDWRERARTLIVKIELNKIIEQTNHGSEPARQGVGSADSDKG